MATEGTPPPHCRWPYLVSAVALCLDQVSKSWFLTHYDLYESRVVIPGFFSFTYVRNTGAAFSLFLDHPEWLMLFSIVVFGLMVVFRTRMFSPARGEQFAFGLLLGGILGNLVDRMKFGYVVDFLDVYVGDHHWPVFNLADSWICIGVGLYLLFNLRKSPPTPASKGDTPA